MLVLDLLGNRGLIRDSTPRRARPGTPNVASQVWRTLTPARRARAARFCLILPPSERTCRRLSQDVASRKPYATGSDQHKVRPMTIRTESRIKIASSVREVWAYVCDVGRWPEWAPT